jgi:hypothetical protein
MRPHVYNQGWWIESRRILTWLGRWAKFDLLPSLKGTTKNPEYRLTDPAVPWWHSDPLAATALELTDNPRFAWTPGYVVHDKEDDEVARSGSLVIGVEGMAGFRERFCLYTVGGLHGPRWVPFERAILDLEAHETVGRLLLLLAGESEELQFTIQKTGDGGWTITSEPEFLDFRAAELGDVLALSLLRVWKNDAARPR